MLDQLDVILVDPFQVEHVLIFAVSTLGAAIGEIAKPRGREGRFQAFGSLARLRGVGRDDGPDVLAIRFCRTIGPSQMGVRQMPKKFPLGFGNGALIEHDDGTVSYRKTGEITQAFRVRIADVRGFSVTKHGRVLTRMFHVLGNGTTLASVELNHGTAELIEKWFNGHPSFNTTVATVTPNSLGSDGSPTSHLIADELKKLAELRDLGVLTQQEFDAQKTKLLSR